MGHVLKHTCSNVLAPLLLICAGCGGGSNSPSSNIKPASTPSPDFAITLSSSSLSISQGTTGAPITISVTAQNGFIGTVQVTLAGVPNGVVANPASQFSMATGATALVVLGVLPNAATGNFMITAQGMSGSLSHSVTLALAVQAFVGPPLPRTTYVRTDAVLASDDPPGEARHRRIAYDAANKHLFVANRAMNRIEVFSTPDQARVTQINIPAACSADMSADGGTVWVGTTTEQAVAIDTATLHVRSRYSIQPLTPLPNSVFEIRSAGLTLAATPARPELEQIPARVLVPGLALHPTGALLYQPFLTGPAPAAPPAIGIQGGVDILDAHTGRLRLRIFLPEPLAALSTDIDALHGSFLAIDETGQRIFALTTSGVAIIQLATVPLSIGTISPNSASSSGGTTLTIRGSGFQSGATVTIGGTPAATTFVDINTLSVITPTLPTGPLQVVIITADGDSYSLDAALTSN